MSTETRVRQHFDADAVRFDDIYADEKPFLSRFVDSKIRGVVVERLRLARALAPAGTAWSALDVGCGSGRYGIALAGLGARRVLGLDFAPKMVELARKAAADAGFDSRCAFEVCDYLAFQPAEKFDLVLAMGYFDYIADPAPHLRRMLDACAGHLLASFPKRWEWRVPVRRARFAMHKSYVRFFSRRDVNALVTACGLDGGRAYVLDFGRDYILIARP